MGAKTSIEWCDATWNPVVGCSAVSPGCAHCYAKRIVTRFPQMTGAKTVLDYGGEQHPLEFHGWDGRAHFMPHKIEQPLRWKKPRRIFVCSMGDLFHESITDDKIDAVFGIMWACMFTGTADVTIPGHVFILLTKRPQRAAEYFAKDRRQEWSYAAAAHCSSETCDGIYDQTYTHDGPHPRIWLGVSVEKQKNTDRIEWLLNTPAAKRWVSLEPLLGYADIGLNCVNDPSKIDWVVAGAETGPGKRPMELDWARSVRDQCQEAGTPFFFKQDSQGRRELDGRRWEEMP